MHLEAHSTVGPDRAAVEVGITRQAAFWTHSLSQRITRSIRAMCLTAALGVVVERRRRD